jgi:hypothetical protein
MPADATNILAAVKAALGAVYSTISVQTSKRRAAEGKPLEGGWTPGYPETCFVVTCGDAEEIDKVGTFEHVSVGYRVLVEYIKPSQQTVTDAVDAGPVTVVEDPDVRDKRQAIRRALFVSPMPGFSAGFHVGHMAKPPYEQMADGGAVLLVSGELFLVILNEARG